jgi:hypothetical protein
VSEPIFVEQAPTEGREHRPGTGATIGREGCDIVLSDSEVSRRHAMVRREGDVFVIEDLGSTNGTFVNGERITAPRRLTEGDEVRFGDTVWSLRGPAGATRIAPTAQPTAAAGHPPLQPAAAPGLRGDVPAPDFQPSTIRRIVPPPGAPAAFSPAAPRHGRGSAATRFGATLAATVVVALTAAGVVLYYLTEPFK